MWTYQSKPINSHEDLDPKCVSIVYIIEFENNKFYVGKLVVRSMRRLKPTKAQLAIRKNYKRVELKNIAFQDYVGTSDETKGLKVVNKTILHQCSNKKTATYLEAKILHTVNAIFSDDYLNKNISGVYFDNSLDGLIEVDTTVDKLQSLYKHIGEYSWV
jgi:hypothetical protein